LAEITAFGKPAIVSPYPYAIGDHQTKNARVLESAGAVRIVADGELADGALIKNVVELMKHRATLAYMAGKARLFGRPEAAQTIAEEIFKAVRPRQ
jgi:UDP-N-acetylglucosamine--N-acetylmuramyl-(pentapeptide) pyrophosphoryl-undecaprenol N-acetylglucosamine transferase